jgi:hypothetical protein
VDLSPYSHTNERNRVDLNNFSAIIKKFIISAQYLGELEFMQTSLE